MLSQVDLAVGMGDRYDQTMISHVESGRSGLVADGIAHAALVLNTSADYLLRLTDDPTPARDQEDKSPTVDIVAVNREAVLAGNGGGSTVVAGQGGYSFSRSRLEDEGIDPAHASVFRVRDLLDQRHRRQGNLALSKAVSPPSAGIRPLKSEQLRSDIPLAIPGERWYFL